MSARDRILGKIGAGRAVGMQAVEERLREHPRGPTPSCAKDLTGQVIERATALASDVVRAGALSEAPIAIARYLDMHGILRSAICWREFAALPWREHGVEVEVRGARGNDAVGITGAFAVIAETGTLMMLSGATTPATVSLLPETHIAIVSADRIVATMEDAWGLLRTEHGAVPRAVNFISGPSRTADVEQTVTLGAHGPRRVLIVLVG